MLKKASPPLPFVFVLFLFSGLLAGSSQVAGQHVEGQDYPENSEETDNRRPPGGGSGGGSFEVDGGINPVAGRGGACKGGRKNCTPGRDGGNYHGNSKLYPDNTASSGQHHDHEAPENEQNEHRPAPGGGRRGRPKKGRKNNSPVVVKGEDGESTFMSGNLVFQGGHHVVASNGADCPGPKCHRQGGQKQVLTTTTTTPSPIESEQDERTEIENVGGNHGNQKEKTYVPLYAVLIVMGVAI